MRVVEGGWTGLDEALDVLKKGLSGEKFVLEIGGHECMDSMSPAILL